MEEKKDAREFENFHIVLWLMKDICWVTGLKLMGTIMVLPTVSMAIYIVWLTRKAKVDFFHNLAVVCWICANSAWMLGEFYFDETPMQYVYEYTRYTATGFFILGLCFVFWYHLEKRLVKKNA